MKRTGGIAALALAGLLSGCGSGSSGHSAPKPITKQQYIRGLHDQGLNNTDAAAVDKMISSVKSGECGQPRSQLKINAALIMDSAPAMLKTTRLTIKYACPETIAAWDKAVAEVNALD